jgi:sarcosine oxidase delta subunit
MGSSREYWEHARECARWAQEAKNKEDQVVLREIAKAWAHIALVDSDIARHAAIDQFIVEAH